MKRYLLTMIKGMIFSKILAYAAPRVMDALAQKKKKKRLFGVFPRR